jgi:hypothetical protein
MHFYTKIRIRIRITTFNFQNARYLFARGRLKRYEELKDGMFEGGVGTQDERQVSW